MTRRFYQLLPICLILVVGPSCTTKQMTVAPSAIVSKEASFDGNVANSGIVDAVPGEGFIVTAHWVERYDGLLAKYGSRLTPPVAVGNRIGITEKDGRVYVTSEVLVRFARLNQWRKAEQTP